VEDKAKGEDRPLCDNARRWRPSVPIKTFDPRQWQRRLTHVEGFIQESVTFGMCDNGPLRRPTNIPTQFSSSIYQNTELDRENAAIDLLRRVCPEDVLVEFADYAERTQTTS